MNCLYCGLETFPSEVYEGTQLYTCREGHRTGILIESQELAEDKKNLKVA